MFNVSTFLLNDALKPATPLTAPLVSGIAGFSASSSSKEDTLNIWCKNWRWVFSVCGLYRPGEWRWINSNSKMETRHPVDIQFRSYGSLKSLEFEKVSILAFFGKTTPYGKIPTILFRKYSPPHRSTCCVQISWHLADGKSVKSCVIYLTKKKQNFASPSHSRFCTDRAQSLPGTATDNVRSVLEISSISVHFRRSYSRTREHRWNAQ